MASTPLHGPARRAPTALQRRLSARNMQLSLWEPSGLICKTKSHVTKAQVKWHTRRPRFPLTGATIVFAHCLTKMDRSTSNRKSFEHSEMTTPKQKITTKKDDQSVSPPTTASHQVSRSYWPLSKSFPPSVGGAIGLELSIHIIRLLKVLKIIYPTQSP